MVQVDLEIAAVRADYYASYSAIRYRDRILIKTYKGVVFINNSSVKESKKQRDPFVDIIKAIGIISIVIGHSYPINIPVIKFHSTIFVYGYHLMIFMFVLGFLFKKESATPPFQYIGKTIYSLGTLYASYSVVFVLLHNLLIKWGFIAGVKFNFSTFFQKIMSSFVFGCDESMLGAFWFIPMYAFLAVLFSS
jgi:fucose 4-O-acetylase-like acetyltransferase